MRIIISESFEFLSGLRSGKKTVVAVACAHDAHVLESAVCARDRGIADFALFGDSSRIHKIAGELSLSLDGMPVTHTGDDAEAAAAAVALVRAGGAGAVMKGLLETSVIMKAALDKERGIRTGRRLSHLAMFILPSYGKPLFVTDAAVNIAPDLELKKDIIGNAVLAARSLGIATPKVALVCAKEKTDPKMPVTLEYEALVNMNKTGEIANCLIGGPFALDNAVSPEAARVKGIDHPVAGDADIILCPDIEAGNILYKSLTMFAGAGVGGVLLGARVPVIITSRSDSAENKLLSIALGAVIGGVNEDTDN